MLVQCRCHLKPAKENERITEASSVALRLAIAIKRKKRVTKKVQFLVLCPFISNCVYVDCVFATNRVTKLDIVPLRAKNFITKSRRK